MCNIYFVRHGESIANADNLVGISLSPLSILGTEQTKILDEKLSGIDFSAIYSSEFRRALETAEIIAHGHKIQTDKRLNEWNIGRLDGKSQNEFDKRTSVYFDKKSIAELDNAFSLRLFSEMETPEEVARRINFFIKEISANNLGKNILAITHGAVLGFLLIHLGYLKLNQLPEFGKIIPNTNFVQILSDGKNIKLKFQDAKLGTRSTFLRISSDFKT